MPARHRAERLVGSLQDALRADVDPRARRHLAVHDQSRALELAEVIPRRPSTDEVAVGNEHAWRPAMRAEDAHGLATLHEERLVVLEVAQRAHDSVERLPASRRAS